MKRLDISQRDKVRQLFGNIPLLGAIDRQAGKYALPPYALELRPEEIFQMVVAWIDRMKTEPDNDVVADMMQQAWNRQWRDLKDMEELAGRTCRDGEVEELSCVILCWVYECFVMLSSERVDGNLWYRRFAENLLRQLMGHLSVWMEVRGQITKVCGDARSWNLLKDWLIGYVEHHDAPLTTVQGDLILQEDGMFLALPSGVYDPKMYSEDAQKIWKALVDKKWCSKQGSVLVWEKSNLSLGYLVKIMSNKLGVFDPTCPERIAWQPFQGIFKGLEGSFSRQAKTGASKVDMSDDYHKWPKDAQDLRMLIKCAV